MLGAKGAYGPGYNIQISTDAQAKIIVAMGVTQSSSDAGELAGAVAERIETNLGQKPEQMVVDAAYPTHQALEAMAEQEIDLIGPLREGKKVPWNDPLKRRGIHPEFYPEAFCYDPSTDHYRCPAEKLLSFETEERKPGWVISSLPGATGGLSQLSFSGAMLSQDQKGTFLAAYGEDGSTDGL